MNPVSSEVSGHREAFRTCPLCEATCGLKLTIEEGEVTRVEGDPDDVFSHGFLCPKGAVLHHLDSDPDRLRLPQVREGDTWRDASWEEAFARIEEGLMPLIQKYGRNAVAMYLGNPNVHNLSSTIYLRPLIKTLRTQNLFSASTVDQMPKHVSSGWMFGHPRLIPVPDIDRTDYLLMLGANPWVSNGSLCTAPDMPGRLKAIRKRGGKIVVVDPRKTRSAREADEHLWIQPGMDALFLLGIASTLFEEGLVNTGDLREHCTGLVDVQDWVKGFRPEQVASHCHMEAGTIRRIARELTEAPTSVVYGRIGTCTTEFGSLSSWLIDVINVLTGHLDRPGGAMFPMSAHSRYRENKKPGGRGFRTGRWHSRVGGHPEVMGELPVAALAEEIETPGEGQVRALLTIAGNPVLSTPNGHRLEKALGTLDFMVCVDPYRNETTRYADVILPPPSPLQRSHYDLAFYDLSIRNVANYSEPIFPLQEGCLEESAILLHLIRMFAGQDASVPLSFVDDFIVKQWIQSEISAEGSPISGREADDILAALGDQHGPERILDFLLRVGPYGDGFEPDKEGLSLSLLREQPHGIDLGALEPRIPEVLATSSGTIELAPPGVIPDMDKLRQQIQQEPTSGLVLIGRRHLRSNNSWMHNLEHLVRGKGRCHLLIHPDDAAPISVETGQSVMIQSRVGALQVTVEVTDDIMPGVVCLPHGWGHNQPNTSMHIAASHPGVNTNILTDEAVMDASSGTSVLNGIPVEISAV